MSTVKLGFKERLNKEQLGNSEQIGISEQLYDDQKVPYYQVRLLKNIIKV